MRKIKILLFSAALLPVFSGAAASSNTLSIGSQNQANQVESALLQNPDDLSAQSALLAFYANAQDETRFTPHFLWMIRNHPEAPAAAIRIYSTHKQNYPEVNAAWEQAVAQHSNSAEVLYHAGLHIETDDPQRALALFKRAVGIDPQKRYSEAVARVYASAFLGTLNATFAAQLRSDLDHSSDAALLSKTGTILVQLGQDQAGLSLIEKAIASDPANPVWTEALDSAKAEPLRRANRKNLQLGN